MHKCFLPSYVYPAESGAINFAAAQQRHKCWSAGGTVSNATMLRGKVIKLSKCCNLSGGKADNLYSSTEPCEEFLNLIKMYNELLMWPQKAMMSLYYSLQSFMQSQGCIDFYFGMKEMKINKVINAFQHFHVGNIISLSSHTVPCCRETEI